MCAVVAQSLLPRHLHFPPLYFSPPPILMLPSPSSSSSSSSVESGGCGREIPTERKRGKRAAVVSECSDSPARLRLHLDPPREFSAFIRRQIGQFVPRRPVTRRTKGKSTSVPSGPIFSLSLSLSLTLSLVTLWCCRQGRRGLGVTPQSCTRSSNQYSCFKWWLHAGILIMQQYA